MFHNISVVPHSKWSVLCLDSRNVAMKLAVVVTLLKLIPLYLQRIERNTLIKSKRWPVQV